MRDSSIQIIHTQAEALGEIPRKKPLNIHYSERAASLGVKRYGRGRGEIAALHLFSQTEDALESMP
jgi:hypothetical protein